ncbi:MAG: dTMP kinase, partial [Anaerolineales bacterium]|nr:dTMP kinase [Anaerolineales bacterium]
VHEVIRPHLEAGGLVVSDRFYDSSFAYQGHGHGLDLETLQQITAFATDGLTPDLTLLLDIPVNVGLARRKDGGNWNRLDDYDLDFHQRVRQGYLSLARDEPDRWTVVDADQSADSVEMDIRKVVEARLSQAAHLT